MYVGGLVGYSDGSTFTGKSFWGYNVSDYGIGNISDPPGVVEIPSEGNTLSLYTDAGWDFVGETANGTEDIWEFVDGVGPVFATITGGIFSGADSADNNNGTNATISKCVITGNTAENGGGIYDCDGEISNCTITGNTANEDGGGLAKCDGTIVNCVIAGNTAVNGGGLDSCKANITNCTIADNIATGECGGIRIESTESPAITNCIVWANTDDNPAAIEEAQIFGGDSPTVTYSCIQSWTSGGIGGTNNIDDDPKFVNHYVFRDITTSAGTDTTINVASGASYAANDIIEYNNDGVVRTISSVSTNEITLSSPLDDDSETGIAIQKWPSGTTDTTEDYHIASDSPCVDTGDVNGDYTGQRDIDLQPRIVDGGTAFVVDRGADEYSSQSVLVYNSSMGTGYQTIQEALGDADSSITENIIIVPIIPEGTWEENITFPLGVNVTLTSSDPMNQDVVEETIISGYGSGDVVTMNSSSAESDTKWKLDGLNIENQTGSGYGVLCKDYADVLIENCIISGNSGTGILCRDYADVLIENCIISGNSGAGIVSITSSELTVKNCDISNNSSEGVSCGQTDLDISDCTINGNGGGTGLNCAEGTAIVRDCEISRGLSFDKISSGVVTGCEIKGPASNGVYFMDNCNMSLSNCLVVDFTTGIRSGDSDNHIKVSNCTVVNYSSNGDGVVYGYFDELTNNIIWGDGTSISLLGNNGNEIVKYSCVKGWDGSEGGVGNIDTGLTGFLPTFVDDTGDGDGDYHLVKGSSSVVGSVCIDAGAPWSDYSLELGDNGGRVNMGAYGGTAEAAETYDTEPDGLPDNWENVYIGNTNSNKTGNPDGDDFNNEIEHLFGYNPGVSNSNGFDVESAVSKEAIDLTNSDTTLSYIVNKQSDVRVVITDSQDPPGVIYDSDLDSGVNLDDVLAGSHTFSWDGTDTSGNFVEKGDYIVTVTVSDGGVLQDTSTSNVNVSYSDEYAIANVKSSPSRIIATNNEVTAISFDTDISANMIIELIAPDESIFRQMTMSALTESELQPGEQNVIVWDGKSDSSKYPSQEGLYTIRVRYAGMRENAEGSVAVYK